MERPYAIFDMDGTLVDSMPYWARLTREYLEQQALSSEEILELEERVETLSLRESAALFQRALLCLTVPKGSFLYDRELGVRSGGADLQRTELLFAEALAKYPSAQVSVGDVIAVCQKSQASPKFKTLIEEYGKKAVPQWIERVADSFEGKIVAMPVREDIDYEVSENLIVELYSR